jgi:hypothetical protein
MQASAQGHWKRAPAGLAAAREETEVRRAATDAPLREAEQPRGLDHCQLAAKHTVEHPNPSLFAVAHRDRLLHPESMDKVAEQSARTKSLSNNTGTGDACVRP